MRTRFLPFLLALLAAPTLHAQFDTSTLAGRVLTRRMEAMEENPAIQELSDKGALDFDSWNIEAMDDATLIELVRLMALGLDREEKSGCPGVMASGDGDAIMAILIAGITDSMEAEAWADVVEQAIWAMANPRPAGPIAPQDELEARMLTMLENLSEEDMAIMNAASTDPGPAACMLMRIMFADLAKADPATAGPLIRGLMSVGMQQQTAEGAEGE